MFDPFFTTNEVGHGTGQGLAISRTIVDRHHGQITFDTVAGEGTRFEIRLPVAGPQSVFDAPSDARRVRG